MPCSGDQPGVRQTQGLPSRQDGGVDGVVQDILAEFGFHVAVHGCGQSDLVMVVPPCPEVVRALGWLKARCWAAFCEDLSGLKHGAGSGWMWSLGCRPKMPGPLASGTSPLRHLVGASLPKLTMPSVEHDDEKGSVGHRGPVVLECLHQPIEADPLLVRYPPLREFFRVSVQSGAARSTLRNAVSAIGWDRQRPPASRHPARRRRHPRPA